MAAPNIRRSNYINLSEQIGSSVQGAIDEKRDRERAEAEELRQAQQAEMQQMQMAQLKQSQYESLNVPADTGVKSADQYIQGASRDMVNAQSGLVNMLKNNEIDTDEFARRSALIKQQIPALQQTKKELGAFQSNYASLLSEGKISKADSGQAGQLYDLIQSGEMLIQPDEEGNMMMMSPEGYKGEPISVPLSQIGRIPKPTPQAPELAELAAGPLAQIGEGEFDPEIVLKSIDTMFTGDSVQDEKTLKAIAVDRLGMSLEQADAMLAESIDSETGATNALEEAVENSILSTAKTQYEGTKIKKEQEKAALALKQAQAANQQRLANGALSPEKAKITAAQINQQNQQLQAIGTYNQLADLSGKFLNAETGGILNEEQSQSYIAGLNAALPQGVSVEMENQSPWYGFGSDYNKPGEIVFYDGDDEIVKVPTDKPELMAQWLKKIAGVAPGS